MEFNKILILENDIESQGLPDVIQDIIDTENVPYETWWWFKQDILQNTADCIKRFAKISKDTMLLTYPSFIGWDNTFESHLHLFEELMKKQIKIRICVVYYSSFYLYVLKYMSNLNGSKKQIQAKLDSLKAILEYHEIYSTEYYKVAVKDISLKNASTRLTFEWLKENYYIHGDKIKVIETGKILRVNCAYIDTNEDDLSGSSISVFKGESNICSSADDINFGKFIRA